jgi:hypothetical protein
LILDINDVNKESSPDVTDPDTTNSKPVGVDFNA